LGLFISMKKILLTALVIICNFNPVVFSQKLEQPKLVASWGGGEDFGEFIWEKTLLMANYLKKIRTVE
jgi:hypothetical protein